MSTSLRRLQNWLLKSEQLLVEVDNGDWRYLVSRGLEMRFFRSLDEVEHF